MRIAILLPDETEAKIAMENAGSTAKPYPGIVISISDERTKKINIGQVFMKLFGRGGKVKPVDDVDMYICLVASSQELPDIEELHKMDSDKVIVFYNLKLDVLRGDLGAPAFPSKEFQDRFLSLVKPVYFLRTRQYTRSVPNPPFMISYQGCMFRSYPGQYQTLLDTGNGSYRRVQGNDIRPPLGVFKEQLTEAMRMDGVLERESETLNFLRTGYKTTTWWEEERPQASDSWKT
eukprot:CAMPEP_0116831472 /NCGR_PEP_ID=MMETSP0418-20121206/5355_1 /TAXON_ID=1158023 /ORGANISM="Astrosyne radiata, Strain 13vi08-1A" /LENGTH=233 /DNA_ID=CAMNT_0004460725 /DNA_START=1 /DNA_END=703 /DNA_ORIENTATION=-